MLKEDGTRIVFCSFRNCSADYRGDCPNAYGININHLNVYHNFLDEPSMRLAEAKVYCRKFDCDELMPFMDEVNHETV